MKDLEALEKTLMKSLADENIPARSEDSAAKGPFT